jgi:hypothetical protein
MYIYRVSRQDDVGYDEQSIVVVTAHDDHSARVMAADVCGNEGRPVWFVSSLTEVTRLGHAEENVKCAIWCQEFNVGWDDRT